MTADDSRGSPPGWRTLLRLAGGGALGLGLTALDLCHPGAARAARPNPNPVLSVWNDCPAKASTPLALFMCVPAERLVQQHLQRLLAPQRQLLLAAP